MTQREEFVKAVEELEACVRNDWMGDDVSRADVRVSRSRLLHLWDDQQAEVERLRESTLTEEEARIIDVHHTARCGYDEWDEAECHCTPEAKSTRAKIRRLKSGSPREVRSDG